MRHDLNQKPPNPTLHTGKKGLGGWRWQVRAWQMRMLTTGLYRLLSEHTGYDGLSGPQKEHRFGKTSSDYPSMKLSLLMRWKWSSPKDSKCNRSRHTCWGELKSFEKVRRPQYTASKNTCFYINICPAIAPLKTPSAMVYQHTALFIPASGKFSLWVSDLSLESLASL